MRLSIHVREWDFEYVCTPGTQTFKWLGYVVAARYAEYHNLPPLTPVNVSSDTHGILYPTERIKHRCSDGDNIYVELLSNRPLDRDHEREVCLWERLAFTPDMNWVTMEFVFDATDIERNGQVPFIEGNLNGWNELIALRRPSSYDYDDDDDDGDDDDGNDGDDGVDDAENDGGVGNNDDATNNNKTKKNDGGDDSNDGGDDDGGNKRAAEPPKKRDIWVHRQRVPAGAQLIFRFQLGDNVCISDSYETVHSADNNAVFNYLEVNKPMPDYSHLRGEYTSRGRHGGLSSRYNPTDGIDAAAAADGSDRNQHVDTSVYRGNSAPNTARSVRAVCERSNLCYNSDMKPYNVIRVQVGSKNGRGGGGSHHNKEKKPTKRLVSQRLIGSSKHIKSGTSADEQEERVRGMFAHDWKKMQFADVVRKRADRIAVKDVLARHARRIQHIFQYYSSRGDGGLSFMSCWEFLGFCHQCKIIDNAVITTQIVDYVFKRVNVEEEFDEDYIEAHPDEYRNAMTLVPDPWNPDHAFIRGEFMESLVRLALRKYPNLAPAVATERILEEHTFKYGHAECSDDMRQRLLDPSVQAVYRVYAKRIRDMFDNVAKLDLNDKDHYDKVSVKEFSRFLAEKHLLDHDLSRRAAMQSFAMAQTLVELEYQMSLSEFNETLGRLAVLKYHKGTIASRLQRFFRECIFHN